MCVVFGTCTQSVGTPPSSTRLSFILNLIVVSRFNDTQASKNLLVVEIKKITSFLPSNQHTLSVGITQLFKTIPSTEIYCTVHLSRQIHFSKVLMTIIVFLEAEPPTAAIIQIYYAHSKRQSY